jgi:hypothetical protein
MTPASVVHPGVARYRPRMAVGIDMPQAGIFAPGTASHAYLELDLHEAEDVWWHDFTATTAT